MLPTIPLVDLAHSSFEELLAEHTSGARMLLQKSRRALGSVSDFASHLVLPVGDRLARGWLERTGNPYAHEIDAWAKAIGQPGVHALNLSYEWGCTSSVVDGAEPTLLRVLDWPFPGLGEHLVTVRHHAPAGAFLNVTWPAISGVFQAMAPGRFAAALNQAPMRRHRGGIFRDWLRNRRTMLASDALPPSHLLRKVFETARDYAEARAMLCEIPVCLPVIYTLSGTQPGEGCVIERIETDHAVRELGGAPTVATANHFASHLNGTAHGWMPRAIVSAQRACRMQSLTPDQLSPDGFPWLTYPIANPLTRLALQTNAATGSLHLQGMHGERPVTEPFTL